MSAAQPIRILWDASHIWGLMAWRAVRALGLPCLLVKGQDIAERALLGKPHAPVPDSGNASLLLVPGGNARLKAQALGPAGREAVRRWLAGGGNYLGFCGGAGLALTQSTPDDGLNICPWTRAGYPQRLHHLISGHVRARVAPGHDFSPPPQAAGKAPTSRTRDTRPCPHARRRDGPRSGRRDGDAPGRLTGQGSAATAQRHAPVDRDDAGLPSLPVWWPGQFAPRDGDSDVQVLAACHRPDADFWLADLPLRSLPGSAIANWRSLYGVNLSADFLEGRPLVVSGAYGAGRYVLSYSHLETPHSEDANAWLARMLARMTGLRPAGERVPLWQLRRPRNAWPDRRESAPLQDALRHMRDLLDLAVEQHLFFARTHWLWGWRTGLPGAGCNNLHAALCTAAALEPTPAALEYWRGVSARFAALERIFAAGAEDYFLACRLAETLSPTLPDVVDKRRLDHQRESLFGHPMNGGGILGELLTITEEIIYRAQAGAAGNPDV